LRFTNLQSQLMIIEALLPHENPPIRLYDAILNLLKVNDNNPISNSTGIIDDDAFSTIDLKALLSDLKDDLYDLGQINGNEISINLEAFSSETLQKSFYPLKIGTYSIVINSLKRMSNGHVNLTLETIQNEKSGQQIKLSIYESFNIDETIINQLNPQFEIDNTFAEYRQLKYGIHLLESGSIRSEILQGLRGGTTYVFFFESSQFSRV